MFRTAPQDTISDEPALDFLSPEPMAKTMVGSSSFVFGSVTKWLGADGQVFRDRIA